MPRALMASAVLALALSSTAAQADRTSTTVAEFPAGTFLENLSATPSGDVVFTSYFARQIQVLDETNDVMILAELTVHPVSVMPIADGYIVTAHGAAFTEGQAFTQTQQILRLDSDGDIVSTLAVPDALFLNGMTELPDGTILIADSIAGTIWQFDQDAETVVPWAQHEFLEQNPNIEAFVPDANGIKQDGDRVLVSNSGRGALYEIALEGSAAASEPTLFAQTGPIDDFWIDEDRIIFTTHDDALKTVETDGSTTTLLAEGCDGCTSVIRRSDAYLVLTTGGMLEGHNEPARMLEIPAN